MHYSENTALTEKRLFLMFKKILQKENGTKGSYKVQNMRISFKRKNIRYENLNKTNVIVVKNSV